jgi:hypothetical protein
LNACAQAPNSSWPSTGSRVSSRPSAGERGRALARPSYGPERAARQQDARARGEQDEDADPAEQDVPQLRQLVPEVVLGEEEVEVRTVRGGRAGDHVALPADLRALVAQLALGHDVP